MDVLSGPLSLLGPLPPVFERRVLVLAPAGSWVYNAAEWQGALVVVARGAIDLEAGDGRCRHFGHGAVLCLERLPLRALHNRGAVAAVLVAVSRRSIAAKR